MATKEQMETIQARRMDDVARGMIREGVTLTWEQADEIGDVGVAWLRGALGLDRTSFDVGPVFAPPPPRDVR